jgi:lipid II:glycine glycyltransferase (peptidoglycan interpeptide bridge formation enzyme)
MKPKWRYNIRLSERKGVCVREGRGEDLATFYDLLQVTARRDRFEIHSLGYYRAAFDLLVPDRARLLIAEFEGEPLAAIFVSALGEEAIYLYGASGNSHRELMPNHALHWAAMQWARARGCTRYDLWGIGEENAVQSVPESASARAALPAGLYQFKQGFGGSIVRYISAYDAILSRARHALYARLAALGRGGWTVSGSRFQVERPADHR